MADGPERGKVLCWDPHMEDTGCRVSMLGRGQSCRGGWLLTP